jgi:Domain of unknown function (DUF4123)
MIKTPTLDPGAVAGAVQRLLAASTASSRAFALVDGALLGELSSQARRRWSAMRGLSLLERAGFGAAEVGPLLYELTEADLDADLPGSLLDAASGRTAGSFIVSSGSAAELQQRLGAFVDVHLSDGSNMVMRFFDPRVLPFWLDALAPDERHYLSGTLQHWAFWRTDFDVAIQRFQPETPLPSAPLFPIRLSSEREATMMNACYPLTLIERLRAEEPEVLAKVPALQRYQFFREQSARAHAHGLEAQGDLEAYCSTAIEFGARFDEDNAVKASMLGIKEGRAFHEVLMAITPSDWQRIKASK